MSRLISRILLSIFMLPLAAVIYFVGFVICYEIFGYRHDEVIFTITGLGTWFFLAGYWLLLWWKTIQWSMFRVVATIFTFAVASIAGVVAGGTIYAIEDEVGLFIGTVTAPIVWLVLTIFVWRETAAERTLRINPATGADVKCPDCGYSLTGLSQCACPECGWQGTIDQLFALQEDQAPAELERG
ncbi:MAG: hypothetical protein R3336_05540 [Phycisphaeraceae bacterium]|nr:hypothetical protein [Phycisphaeraceae bacterium]